MLEGLRAVYFDGVKAQFEVRACARPPRQAPLPSPPPCPPPARAPDACARQDRGAAQNEADGPATPEAPHVPLGATSAAGSPARRAHRPMACHQEETQQGPAGAAAAWLRLAQRAHARPVGASGGACGGPKTLHGPPWSDICIRAKLLAPATSRAAPPCSSAGGHDARASERPSAGSLRQASAARRARSCCSRRTTATGARA